MAIIIPPSTVNLMSNKEDCCFQYQDPGHIAWHCPDIRCYESEEYGHIIMVCPHRIPPSRTPVMHHKLHKSHHTRLNLKHHDEDWNKWSKSRSQSHYRRHCSSSHHDSHRGHSRSQHWDRHSHYRAVHNNLAQPTEDTATDLVMTHHTSHITDHHNILALQVISPEIAVDCIHNHPTDLQGMNLADQIHTPAGQEVDHITRRTWRWRLKIHTLIITAPMITPATQERTQILQTN